MRTLGIDPGTRRTGWGIVEARGPALHCIASGVCQAKESLPLAERLVHIHTELCTVVTAHAPQQMAIEDIFYAKYASAALKLGHVRGVILLAAAQHALPVCSLPPALVKRAIAGRGAADKGQVARIVAAMLRLKQLPAADASDALAIALTAARSHAFHAGARGLAQRTSKGYGQRRAP
ncbi:MAG: crossover junction endodeoxyribonuclease RuvC [Polyangiales bacterium]